MATIEVRRISSALGATVRGLDLTRQLTQLEIEQLMELYAEHLLLVFPDQDLSAPSHVRLAEYFGEPYIHPFLDAVPEHPAVLQVLKEADDRRTFGGEFWHNDISFTDPPAATSLLHGKEIPSLGGDTLFANQYLAYEALSPGLRKLLGTLSAHHTYPDMTENDPGASALHPVLRVHPLTGRRALFVNAAFVERFDDMTVEESRPLLQFLFAHQIRPEFQARVTWQTNTLVVWDNRATLHYAMNDHQGSRRRLERVTCIEGSEPGS